MIYLCSGLPKTELLSMERQREPYIQVMAAIPSGPEAGLLVFNLEGSASSVTPHCMQSGQDKKVEMLGLGPKQVKREKE